MYASYVKDVNDQDTANSRDINALGILHACTQPVNVTCAFSLGSCFALCVGTVNSEIGFKPLLHTTIVVVESGHVC